MMEWINEYKICKYPTIREFADALIWLTRLIFWNAGSVEYIYTTRSRSPAIELCESNT